MNDQDSAFVQQTMDFLHTLAHKFPVPSLTSFHGTQLFNTSLVSDISIAPVITRKFCTHCSSPLIYGYNSSFELKSLGRGRGGKKRKAKNCGRVTCFNCEKTSRIVAFDKDSFHSYNSSSGTKSAAVLKTPEKQTITSDTVGAKRKRKSGLLKDLIKKKNNQDSSPKGLDFDAFLKNL